MEDSLDSFDPTRVELMLLSAIEELQLRRWKSSEDTILEDLICERDNMLQNIESERHRVSRLRADIKSAVEKDENRKEASEGCRVWSLKRETDDLEDDCGRLAVENCALREVVGKLEKAVAAEAQAENVTSAALVQKAIQAVHIQLAKLTGVQQEVQDVALALKEKTEEMERKSYREMAALAELRAGDLSRPVVCTEHRRRPRGSEARVQEVRRLQDAILRRRSDYCKLLSKVPQGDLSNAAVQTLSEPSS